MDNNQSAYDRQRWCCEQCQRRCRGTLHVIKAGETLYSISRMYNVSVPEIMRANPYVNVYNLRINDQICIPNNMMIMPYPEMPDDYFEMPGNMSSGMMPPGQMNSGMMMPGQMNDGMNMMPWNNMGNNMGMMPGDGMNMGMDNVNMPDRVNSMSNNSFSEDDSVKDMLKKTGMTMETLLSRINEK